MNVSPDALLPLLIDSISTNSIIISLILAGGVSVNSYNISYNNSYTDCIDNYMHNVINNVTKTGHTLTDLKPGTEYSITVRAILSDGITAVEKITTTTIAAG